MQNSELTVKETEELQKSIATDLKKEDNNDKFAESIARDGESTDEPVSDAGEEGSGDDQEDCDTAS